jgi:hypothetical protein
MRGGYPAESRQRAQAQRADRFSKLVKKEKQLIGLVFQAFQKRIKELETEDVWIFEDILAQAVLAHTVAHTRDVGRNFALSVLPQEIAERVTNSRAPQTH